MKVSFQIISSYIRFVCGAFKSPEVCGSFFLNVDPHNVVNGQAIWRAAANIQSNWPGWTAAAPERSGAGKSEGFTQAGTATGSGNTLKPTFVFFMVLPSSDPAVLKMRTTSAH